MARTKKITPVMDIVTINATNYVISGINVNKDGTVDHADVAIRHLVSDVNSGEIFCDPLIQRTADQWTKKLRAELIISILKKRPCGTILIAAGRPGSENYSRQTLLDGLQRTTAICDFVNNKFSLPKNTSPISCYYTNENDKEDIIVRTYDIAGKKFSQLPAVLQQSILNYTIPVCYYTNFSDAELDKIMFCANSGKAPTINQKLKYYLGSDNLRLLVPLMDSPVWENVKDCKEKNETILACIIRILILVSQYGDCTLNSSTMNKFVENYCDIVTSTDIEEAEELLEQFAKIKFKMTDKEIQNLNGCNIPHIIMNMRKYNMMENPENKSYIDFLRAFWASEDAKRFEEWSKAGGSGGAKYSSDNVIERQYIMDDFLDVFLDHIRTAPVQQTLNPETADMTKASDDTITEADVFDDSFDIDTENNDNDSDNDNINDINDFDIISDNEGDDENEQEYETADGTGEYQQRDKEFEEYPATEQTDNRIVSENIITDGQTDSGFGQEKSVTYVYTDKLAARIPTGQGG